MLTQMFLLFHYFVTICAGVREISTDGIPGATVSNEIYERVELNETTFWQLRVCLSVHTPYCILYCTFLYCKTVLHGFMCKC